MHSAVEFVDMVFGGWLELAILPYVNLALEKKHSHKSGDNRKHYVPVTKRGLLAYFLDECIRALEDHRKHSINARRMQDAKDELCGMNRSKAIRGLPCIW
jgi:hypothetical protein